MTTLLDFFEAAPGMGLPHRTLLEIEKLPRRLGLDEVEDLVEYQATPKVFEERVAPSGAAVFGRANDPTKARAEANSRLRSALRAFLGSTSARTAPAAGLADWDLLHDWVEANEGFPHRGARYTKGQSGAVACLRARFPQTPPRDATAEQGAAVVREAPSGKRKSIRKALGFLERLRLEADDLPAEVRMILPAVSVAPFPARREAHWPDLPEGLRAAAEAVFDAVLADPSVVVEEALARIRAGEDPQAVAAEVNRGRAKGSANPTVWRQSHRGAVAWLYRAAMRRSDGSSAEGLDDLFGIAIIEAAIEEHIADAAAGRLRPSDETQTLSGRLRAVRTLARHGLRDLGLVAVIDLLRDKHAAHTKHRHVKGLSKPAETLVTGLHRGGEPLMRRLVNAPQLVEEAAREEMAGWETMTPPRRLAAVKLAAGATMWTLQMARARRRANLICDRLKAAREPETRAKRHPRTLWEDGDGYTSRTPGLETKNGADLEFGVEGADAEVLRWWIEEVRPLALEERGIPAGNIYLFPGEAAPRNLRRGVVLPDGTVSAAWFAEAWARGAAVIGLDLSTHQARHAVVTIWLHMHPGDYAGAAALVGSGEGIVRRKYGRDDGAAVSKTMRRESRQHFNGGGRCRGRS